MANRKIIIGGEEFQLPAWQIGTVILIVVLILVGISLLSSFYTVDANENGIVLRFGKYVNTTDPGLHFKLPWGIDRVYKVKVGYQFKEEFGFRTVKPGIQTQYSAKGYTTESWMLTGDLNIADVQWIVQYKIKDAREYLFNVRDVVGTIRDVAEAAMRLMVGDRSFHEVLQIERALIAQAAAERMQELMDDYNAGVKISVVQLQDVHPPSPVKDSFNEVNRAKQEQETMVNEARQTYNKEIYRAKGEAQRMINEAQGYATDRVNRALGDADKFKSILKEYSQAKDVTRRRMYIETLNEILQQIDSKYIIDKDVKNLLPFLSLPGKEVKP